MVGSYALQDHLKDPFGSSSRLGSYSLAIYEGKINPKHYFCAFIIAVRRAQLLKHLFN